MYDYKSEDIELPENKSNIEEDYGQNNYKETGNAQNPEQKNKKIIIAVVVGVGVLVLAVIIFLVIFFSSKKKNDGGSITVIHQLDLDSDNEITIFNVGNLKSNEYEINIKEDKLSQMRLLEENTYQIDK